MRNVKITPLYVRLSRDDDDFLPFRNIMDDMFSRDISSLISCETCGKSMQSRYEKVGRTGVNRVTKEERQAIDKAYYICQTYNRLGKHNCTSHKIEARDNKG